jgi:multisubunit Na+/H+ antiporter MnhB subunit
MQPPQRPWEGGLAWAGIVGGFVAGLILGIVALVSYFRWQEKKIPKPTAAWVIGGMVLALVGVGMIRPSYCAPPLLPGDSLPG